MSAHDLRGAVLKFHETYGHPVRDQPTLAIPDHEIDLAFELIAEELNELSSAVAAGNLTETADALGDLLWVVQSMAVRFGINTDRVLHEIELSNASKLGADGKPIVREDGKILKGPNFTEPDIARALDYGHLYAHDTELDASVDYVLAPSGGLANQYLPVEYPQLAQLRVLTPLSLHRLEQMPIRDVYVMKGIMVGYDWPELQDRIEAAQEPGARIFGLDC